MEAVVRRGRGEWRQSPTRCKVGPTPEARSRCLDFGILGKGKCVLHVNSEIAHRILDLAMTEEDLDGAKVAGRPVDY
jgi:hypothetical protein